jgi:hypothetical protein
MCLAAKDIMHCFASLFDEQADQQAAARVEAAEQHLAMHAAVLPAEGDLVWAHMTGYGWWPGFVDSMYTEDAEDTEEEEDDDDGGGGGGGAAAAATAAVAGGIRRGKLYYEIRWVQGGFTKTALDKIVPFQTYFAHRLESASSGKDGDGWQKDVEKACRHLLAGEPYEALREEGERILDSRERWGRRVAAFSTFLTAQAGVEMVENGHDPYYRRAGAGRVPEPELFKVGDRVFFMQDGRSYAGTVETSRVLHNGRGGGDDDGSVEFNIHSDALGRLQNERNWVPQLMVLPRTAEIAKLLQDVAFFLWMHREVERERVAGGGAPPSAEAGGSEGGEGGEGCCGGGGGAARGVRMQAATPSRFNVRQLGARLEGQVRAAIESHRPAVVTALFASDLGLTPTPEMLHHAVRASTALVLRALFAFCSPNMCNATLQGASLLHVATELGARQKVEALLAEGADIARRDAQRQTALHIAASKGCAPILRVLLQHQLHETGAGRDAAVRLTEMTDRHGYTALHCCSEYGPGSASCAAVLLDAGANIDREGGPDRRTPLWWASSKGQCALIQLLVARGADFHSSLRPGFAVDISLGISNIPIAIQPRDARHHHQQQQQQQQPKNKKQKTAHAPNAAAAAADEEEAAAAGSAASMFADYRNFVFVERSVGDSRDSRKCCDHTGPCTSENKCPCAKKNSERGLEPYGADGSLDVPGEKDALVIFECTDACRCSHEECQIGKVRRGLTKELRVEWVDKKGWGVFTRERIFRGQYVVAYAGEVLEKAAKDERESERQAENLIDTYLIEVEQHWSIDGTHVGNVSRLFNHSCDPNLTHKKVDIGNKCPTIAFFANKDIEAGEELTWSYSKRSNKTAHSTSECNCGATKCRKFL